MKFLKHASLSIGLCENKILQFFLWNFVRKNFCQQRLGVSLTTNDQSMCNQFHVQIEKHDEFHRLLQSTKTQMALCFSFLLISQLNATQEWRFFKWIIHSLEPILVVAMHGIQWTTFPCNFNASKQTKQTRQGWLHGAHLWWDATFKMNGWATVKQNQTPMNSNKSALNIITGDTPVKILLAQIHGTVTIWIKN